MTALRIHRPRLHLIRQLQHLRRRDTANLALGVKHHRPETAHSFILGVLQFSTVILQYIKRPGWGFRIMDHKTILGTPLTQIMECLIPAGVICRRCRRGGGGGGRGDLTGKGRQTGQFSR